jgi:phosphohistidine phosphatase SixA
MKLLLVRHASAGDRDEWRGDDDLRPLDDRGHRQAEGLVDLLRPYAPERVVSSPSLRCRQTVEPLALALGLDVEDREELTEGSSLDEVVRLAAALADGVAAFCTHGDVVAEVVGRESKKGSTWILKVDKEKLEPLEHLPAPN